MANQRPQLWLGFFLASHIAEVTRMILILLVFAFVLFAISAVWNPTAPWYPRLVAAGLAFWVLTEILRGTSLLR